MTAPTTPSPERQPADAGGGLLPCPMCEGPGHLQHTVQQLDDGWHVICHGKKDCPLFCSTPYRLHDTKAEARAAWNRRNPAPQAQPDARAVEALRAADEALAMVTAFESDARYIMGNTNFTILQQRREQVKQVLQALSAPAADDGWRPSREDVEAAIRKHVKCDASGLSPAVASVFLTGLDEAADAVLALHPAAPTDEVGK